MKENKLGTMPIKKLILTMAWPMMLSMFIQALYNMVDSHYVSLADPKGFLALSLVYPAQMLMIAICVGTGVGINAMLSRRLGEQRHEEACAVAGNGFVLYFCTWLLFLVLGLTMGPQFTGWFSQDTQVSAYGGAYLTLVMCGSLGMCMQFACERVLQASGRSMEPMIIQGVGAILNIVLDPIFIFDYGMGIRGAALATILGQVAGMVLGFLLVWHSHFLPLTADHFRPNRQAIRDIYMVGVPAMAMTSLNTFMSLGLNKILVLPTVTKAMGDTPVFILGAYFKLQSFLFMPMAGLNNGSTPVLSYNYGAQNRKRLEDSIRFALHLSLAIMGIGTLIFLLFPTQLLALFSTPEAMMPTGVFALRVIATSFLCGGITFILSGILQALDRPNQSLLLGLTRQIIIVLPVCLLFALIMPQLVWLSIPIAEVVSFVLALIFYHDLRQNQLAQMEG